MKTKLIGSVVFFFSLAFAPGCLRMSLVTKPAPTTGTSDPAPDQKPTVYSHYVYVACSEVSGFVGAYSFDTNAGQMTLINTFAADSNPQVVIVDPSGSSLYASNLSSSDISSYSIDAATGGLTSLGNLAYGSAMGPLSMVFSLPGSTLFVGSRMISSSVSAFPRDRESGALSAPLGPYANASGSKNRGIALSPDGKHIYTADWYSNTVTKHTVDSSTGALSDEAEKGTGNWPEDLAFNAAGSYLYVAEGGGDSIGVFPVSSTDGSLGAEQEFPAGNNPVTIVIDPAGKNLYAADYGGNTTSDPGNNIWQFSIDPATGGLTYVGMINAGHAPGKLAIDPDGQYLFVANQGTSDVMVYSLDATTGEPTQVQDITTCGTVAAAGITAVKIAQPQ